MQSIHLDDNENELTMYTQLTMPIELNWIELTLREEKKVKAINNNGNNDYRIEYDS